MSTSTTSSVSAFTTSAVATASTSAISSTTMAAVTNNTATSTTQQANASATFSATATATASVGSATISAAAAATAASTRIASNSNTAAITESTNEMIVCTAIATDTPIDTQKRFVIVYVWPFSSQFLPDLASHYCSTELTGLLFEIYNVCCKGNIGFYCGGPRCLKDLVAISPNVEVEFGEFPQFVALVSHVGGKANAETMQFLSRFAFFSLLSGRIFTDSHLDRVGRVVYIRIDSKSEPATISATATAATAIATAAAAAAPAKK